MVKIIAIGGGENGRPGTNYETKEIDHEIITLSGKKKPNILFIPPPSRFQESYFDVMQNIFKKFNTNISPLYLNTINQSNKNLEKEILANDIIYVGGGNTLNLMRYFRKYKIDKILRKALERDIVLSGLSAGAICWFKYGCSDSRKFTNPDADLIRVSGLDFFPFLFCPHYDVEKDRKESLKKIMKRTSTTGLAFDNCSAIEIIDDKYRIITSVDNANAYQVYWKNGKYFENKIEKKKRYSPLYELLK
jgi:dipeptidase E